LNRESQQVDEGGHTTNCESIVVLGPGP